VRLGFRSRLFLILALFAIVPSIVLTVAWGGVTSRVLPLMSGAAAWDSVAASGTRAIALVRTAPGAPATAAALARHEQDLANSVTQARRFEYLTRQTGPALLLLGLVLLALLTYFASRIAGHLSRQMSRPLDEVIGWTGRIARGEPLPADRAGRRGAPEFGVLRDRMRNMAAELERGRESAIAAERLEAFRESARQVAHELKNPLTPIRFAIARLRRDASPEMKETLDVLATESERLEAMARSFAQFGRLPEGPTAALDLGELVRDVARTAVPEQITVAIETEPHLPLVRGQHEALHRAFANVLLNAVDSCGRRETEDTTALTVHVAVRKVGESVVVSIRDTGCGIPADRLPRIWDPYVSSKTGGTGLGLAIVKQTVMAHGGHVAAESETGKGTEIRLSFPAMHSEEMGALDATE
jgi:nitrogen fixation/metabolism regulation signal transduction histidine kinase